MRFYNQPNQAYGGVDLHARSMDLHLLDAAGRTRFDKNRPAQPDAFLNAIALCREGLVVGCECLFAWCWLADRCEEEHLPFVLGHALYRKASHGGKTKNDRLDAAKLAALLRGGAFPQAYVSPRDWRQMRRPRRGGRARRRTAARRGRWACWRRRWGEPCTTWGVSRWPSTPARS